MQNIILLMVSDETLENLTNGTKRIHGTIGRTDGGFDFHEHDRSKSHLPKSSSIYRLKHGHISITEKKTSLSLNISHTDRQIASEVVRTEGNEAVKVLQEREFSFYLDHPYGVKF